jgi:hypothetical protein
MLPVLIDNIYTETIWVKYYDYTDLYMSLLLKISPTLGGICFLQDLQNDFISRYDEMYWVTINKMLLDACISNTTLILFAIIQ